MSKPILFLIAVIIILLLGMAIHRTGDNLNVTPQAAKEIEKAKGR